MSIYKRQIDMFNPAAHEEITAVIVGLGNIGSHTALALARMGVAKFILVDFDTVEEHNLSSQSFLLSHLDKNKVDCVAEMILAINKYAVIVPYPAAFQDAQINFDPNSILVSAVDSMSTRYAICDILEKTSPDTFVIDGRLGGGQIEVHAQKVSEWRATLTQDADTDACGARYISYTSYIIAGFIANTLKRYLQKETYTKKLLMHTNTYEVIKVLS